jgi:hypothetical protein
MAGLPLNCNILIKKNRGLLGACGALQGCNDLIIVMLMAVEK